MKTDSLFGRELFNTLLGDNYESGNGEKFSLAIRGIFRSVKSEEKFFSVLLRKPT
jgi:hypothetical protein